MINKFFKKSQPACICKAPFTNMYFRPDGNVTPCCFNTSYSYGKYPDNTIKEIWQGSAIKDFRKLMTKNDLSQGCQICNKHIASKNIQLAGIQYYEKFRIRNNPVKLEFELSRQCNLNCIMCFQPKNVKSGVSVYDFNFIKQVSAFLPNILELGYFGGEPFSIDLYYQLWELTNKTNPDCLNIINTNGTIWNDRVKNIIEHGRYMISVSLDAVDEQLYEDIRINANYTRTIENIFRFSSYMKSHNGKLLITVCPMRNNAYNIPDIIRFTTDINADIFFHTVFFPPDLSLINYPKEELELILKSYQDFLIDFNAISEQNKKSFKKLIDQIKTFIEKWDKSAKLIVLNKDFENCFIDMMNELEKYFNKDEFDVVKNKLHAIFSGIIETFPVVYGINYLMKNNDRDNIISMIQKNTDKELLDSFTRYALTSID